MELVKPITPEQVIAIKQKRLPEEVIESFNDMIIAGWNGSFSRFDRCEVVEYIMDKMGMSMTAVFNSDYLNVGDIFGEAGWVMKVSDSFSAESDPYVFEFHRKE